MKATTPPNRRANRAVALQCADPSAVPSVLFAGGGAIARAIIDSAIELGIPISQQVELTNKLAALPPSSLIPDDSLVLVAEVLAFLFESDQALRSGIAVRHCGQALRSGIAVRHCGSAGSGQKLSSLEQRIYKR